MTRIVALMLMLAAPVVAQTCPGDVDANGSVTVDEIVASVNAALGGCPDALDGLRGASAGLFYGDSGTTLAYEFDDEPVLLGGTWTLGATNVATKRSGAATIADGAIMLREVVTPYCFITELRRSGPRLFGLTTTYNDDCRTKRNTPVVVVYGLLDDQP